MARYIIQVTHSRCHLQMLFHGWRTDKASQETVSTLGLDYVEEIERPIGKMAIDLTRSKADVDEDDNDAVLQAILILSTYLS